MFDLFRIWFGAALRFFRHPNFLRCQKKSKKDQRLSVGTPEGICRLHYLVSFLIVTLSLCSATRADDRSACMNVDMREALGPVRFQDDKSWCYAFAAADLLTYRFRHELKGKRVSAVYTALTYTREYAIDPYSESGGFARFAVTAAQQRGLCPQSLEDNALRRGPLGSLSEKLQSLRTLKAMYDRGDTTRLNQKLEALAKTHSVVSSVPRDALMRALRESTMRTFPIVFADLLCGSYRYKPSTLVQVKSMVKWISGTPRMLKTIDDQLSQENIVAIGYYSAFLIQGSNAPLTERHMSTLVGRRWNGKLNRCEYLIRNSFGPECIGYAGELRAPENCHTGHIWVSKSLLERNLYALTYIKP